MGVYLSAPITDKVSSDETCKSFSYGASSMQGWRMTQEDSHNCIPDFDLETDTSFFAVYDGHGGAEVAKYCSQHLPDYVRGMPTYKQEKLGDTLSQAFLSFDKTLTDETVIKELKVIAGMDDDEEDDEDGDPMGRTEAEALRAEADMPIEDLLAKYDGIGQPQMRRLQNKDDKFLSPMIHAKRPDGEGSSGLNVNNSAFTDSIVARLEDKLANGHADNENNLNAEKELKAAEAVGDQNCVQSAEADKAKPDTCSSLPDSSSVRDNTLTDSTETQQLAGTGQEHSPDVMEADSTSGELCGSHNGSSPDLKSVSSGSGMEASSSAADNPPRPTVERASSSEAAPDGPSSSSSSAQSSALAEEGPSSSNQAASSSSSVEEPGPSGSAQAGGSGLAGSKPIFTEDVDSDDSSEEEDAEYQGDSGEEDDDDEEDSDEDGEEGAVPMKSDPTGTEEPGYDSGCTAVVALIRKNQVVVANVGDSRAVLCRAGKAVDLSADHKPEDDPERTRIEAAGGKVTGDGRVNGGLNLSRALGDHCYKENYAIPPEQQMISASPDIENAILGEEDEFLVLACDGIWNFMTSQEVVDFVRERLKDVEKRKKLSLICEEMFDHCLAPNTMGDGTGCDNMTCIIVLLNGGRIIKRQSCEMDTSVPEETQPEKKVKMDESDSTDT